MAVKTRTPRSVADPGSPDQAIAFIGGAQIIDLMPHDDPEEGVVVRRVADRVPMRHRDRLNPLDPYGVVDVAELVDVLGSGDELELEDGACHGSCGTPLGSTV